MNLERFKILDILISDGHPQLLLGRYYKCIFSFNDEIFWMSHKTDGTVLDPHIERGEFITLVKNYVKSQEG